MEVQRAMLETIAILTRHHGAESEYASRGCLEEQIRWSHIPGWIWEDVMAPHPLGDQHHTADVRALDVGAGHGMLATFIRQIVPWANVMALDVDTSNMPTTLLHEQAITSAPADVQSITLAAYFEVIVLTEVLQHLLWPRRALRMLRDGLAPHRGRLYLSTPDAADARWAGADSPEWRAIYNTAELREMLDNAGLHVERWDTAPGMIGRHHNLTLSALSG